MTGVVGSLRYMAPEVALSKPYNHKSECYSYAIVVWEMTALRRPFEGVTPETFEQRVCAAGEVRLLGARHPQRRRRKPSLTSRLCGGGRARLGRVCSGPR
jgi:serine/threonine protein kinase